MSSSISFKKDNTINIIGCGDVILSRMLPALLFGNMNIEPAHIRIFSTDESDKKRLKAFKAFKGIRFITPNGSPIEKQEAIVKACINQNSPVIIATPSDSHYFYLTKIAEAGLTVICEKPLARFTKEITNIRINADLYRKNLFALSNYSLEKALPLTYFFQLNPAHLPLLEIKNTSKPNSIINAVELSNLLADLGQIEKIDLYLNEGIERSPVGETRLWTEGPNEHAFETLLHLIVLAHKVLKSFSFSLDDLSLDCIRGSCSEGATSGATTYLRLTNWKQQVSDNGSPTKPFVNLTCGKYMPEHLKKRGGRLMFTNGSIDVDFDSMNILVKANKKPEFMITNKCSGKYSSLAALVNRFLHSGYGGTRFDEFDDQVKVLDWMTSFEFETKKHFTYSTHYDGLLEDFEIKNLIHEI
jgi:hypothetical protein